MALPTSDTWDLVDFNAQTFSDLASAAPGEVVVLPGGSPAFALNAAHKGLEVRSSDGVLSTMRLMVGLPSRFTLQVVLRCPQLPHNLGDLETRRFGFVVADDAGRGFSLYFAKTGLSVARVDNFGAMTALPETMDLTRAVASTYFTVRVAVDGGLGRAYIFFAEGETDFPPLRFIVPVEPSPSGDSDIVRIEARGLPNEPVFAEIARLQLSVDLVLANYPPVADAGGDRAATIGSAVRLDGRASYDVEGAPLAYRWRCIDAPYGSGYTAELSAVTTADDGDDDGLTTVIEAEPSQLPAWLQPGDIVRVAGNIYEIEAMDPSTGVLEMTRDLVPDNLTAPARLVRQSILLDVESPTPVVVPDVPGVYRFRLVVGDGDNLSDPSEVLVSVSPLQTPTGIEPDVQMIWKAIGDEWRFVEGRDVFEEAWTGTAQILAGKLLEAWQIHYNTSIRDAPRVFQKKWLAYRTFVPDTAPDETEVLPRYGALVATYPFEQAPVSLPVETLVIERLLDDGTFWDIPITFPAATYELNALVDHINEALEAAGAIEPMALARVLRGSSAARLFLTATAIPFRVSGSAAAVLGLPMDTFNALRGVTGARVTDHTYYAEGVDLVQAGVKRGDLLVVNSGETLRVDRVLSDPADPYPNQRLLLFDPVPLDATSSWEIPSVLRSAEVDYERQGAYPGDLAKIEIAAGPGHVVEDRCQVVGQKGSELAVRLGLRTMAALIAGDEVRVVGLKRRKAIPIPSDVLSVPTLQELIAARLEPTRLVEHVDYILEPFYREEGHRPIPMLQFADSVYIEPDLEPPDILWAETTLFDNAVNVEALFGRLVGFLRDDAAGFPRDFNYVAGVAGLLYAQQHGPRLFSMSVGAQILLGQPFAEVPGFVEEIRPDYSPTQGRILLRDDDGNRPTLSETVRAYYYIKNPSDPNMYSGLALNPVTGFVWKVGELVPQFSALGTGVDLEDLYTDRHWWRIYAGGGAMHEVEKYHRFTCKFDLRLVDLANISLLAALLERIKPTYTRLMLVGDTGRVDDLDIEDDVRPTVRLLPFETLINHYGMRYDDYRGDGTVSHAYDDGVLRCDGLIDSIIETVEFVMTINWPGGVLSFPSTWPFDLAAPVVDVSGAETGSAGSTFVLSNGMDLAAGTYRTGVVKRAGPLLPPL